MIATDRRFARIALATVLVAALGVSACGRKGPLDPPPGAQAAPGAAPGQPQELVYDRAGNPLPPKGEKKSFLFDFLLN